MNIFTSNLNTTRTSSPLLLVNASVVHTPSTLFILSFHSSTSLLSSFYPKPISSKTLLKPLKASTQPNKYIYPDPIPEFAEAETLKFRRELLKKLLMNKEIRGDVDEVVKVCAEIFSDFLRKEYGGPGTLLVEPFTDMLVALKEKKLPGAPEAARAALLWAQNYLDKDWDIWISQATK
ncbi:Plastid redox insensitive [Thalictrum thalictroides]|uniref:Plastid redox insensitive n=1 Tax=Thalictrum thalictroides TaxID=46969 RepID=A0A7J6VDJ5_THATH|nr:Plastid redox insensitive [Thalictrum thalictroides]